MKFDINDQLFLETMLLIIRGNTIKFSSTRKRKNIEMEKRLENEIKIIEDQVNKNLMQLNDPILEELSDKKNSLEQIRAEKIEGVMLRSRSRYEDLGEKPSKYFFNLESRNYTNKVMNKIIDENGLEFTETKDILNCQQEFYK